MKISNTCSWNDQYGLVGRGLTKYSFSKFNFRFRKILFLLHRIQKQCIHNQKVSGLKKIAKGNQTNGLIFVIKQK